MKKILCVALSAAMLVSLTACSKEEPSSAPIQIPTDILQDADLIPVFPGAQDEKTLTEEEAVAADREVGDKLVKLIRVSVFYDDWSWDLEDCILNESFSCYSDSTMTDSDVIRDSYVSWRYNPSKLSADGELYMPNGVMEGMTITFYPVKTEKGTELRIREARIDEMVDGYFTSKEMVRTVHFEEVGSKMCNFLCDILGETIPLQSKTYQNSTFTVFVNCDMDDEEEMFYGLWNGTNIAEDMKYDVQELDSIASATLENEASLVEKDNSTMAEACSAILLSLADQDVYDELLAFACTNNISTYLDIPSEDHPEYLKIVQKAAEGNMPEQYTLDFNGQHDSTLYKGYVGGNLTGLTLTFVPQGDGYNIGDAIINKYIVDDSYYAEERVAGTPKYKGDTPDYNTHDTLRNLSEQSRLFNRLRAMIGDNLTLYSESCTKSEYTIFIALPMDGPEGTMRVYGQWQGAM